MGSGHDLIWNKKDLCLGCINMELSWKCNVITKYKSVVYSHILHVMSSWILVTICYGKFILRISGQSNKCSVLRKCEKMSILNTLKNVTCWSIGSSVASVHKREVINARWILLFFFTASLCTGWWDLITAVFEFLDWRTGEDYFAESWYTMKWQLII